VLHRYFASGSFSSAELELLTDVFQDVCCSVEETGMIELSTHARETIATAIFNLAEKGVRDPDRLRSRALREVEAFNGVQITLSRIAGSKRNAGSGGQ
jgi:hypothetical protein